MLRTQASAIVILCQDVKVRKERKLLKTILVRFAMTNIAMAPPHLDTFEVDLLWYYPFN